MKNILNLVLMTGFLIACTATRPIDVLPGVPIDLVEFNSFELNSEPLPAFLGPALVSNFAVALAEKGYEPVVTGGDVIITLRLVQEQVAEQQINRGPSSSGVDSVDPFAEQIIEGGETRFIARIVVEFRNPGDPTVQWTGSIQRLHSIRAGDYMHMGPASNAFLQAFRELLADYPGPRAGKTR